MAYRLLQQPQFRSLQWQQLSMLGHARASCFAATKQPCFALVLQVRALSFVVTMLFDLWLEKHPTQVSERPGLVLLGGSTAVACAFWGAYLHWQRALGNADAYNLLPRVHTKRSRSGAPELSVLQPSSDDKLSVKHV